MAEVGAVGDTAEEGILEIAGALAVAVVVAAVITIIHIVVIDRPEGVVGVINRERGLLYR